MACGFSSMKATSEAKSAWNSNFFFFLLFFRMACCLQVNGFLEKNRDRLRDDLRELLSTSSTPFVAALLGVEESLESAELPAKKKSTSFIISANCKAKDPSPLTPLFL